jgi:hypothetical protein
MKMRLSEVKVGWIVMMIIVCILGLVSALAPARKINPYTPPAAHNTNCEQFKLIYCLL